jgi:hypothetical protein
MGLDTLLLWRNYLTWRLGEVEKKRKIDDVFFLTNESSRLARTNALGNRNGSMRKNPGG